MILPAAANPNNLEITMPADGIPFLKTATDALLAKPGGAFVLLAPDADGIPVGAGATDQLDIVNPGGAGSCTYRILVIGAKS